MVNTPYDQIADGFSVSRAKLHPKEAEYLALLLESLNRESSVLDLGCGTGKPIATYVASRGYQVVGVDGSVRVGLR
jgi:cyclopropane fatty-acyl-phospholipid synthase-like methyltransferase